MSGPRLPGGVVHKLPGDLSEALIANATALDAWKDITPLARNEFICWVEDAKQALTREPRIRRTVEELEEGQRRRCCWPGCKHEAPSGHDEAGERQSMWQRPQPALLPPRREESARRRASVAYRGPRAGRGNR